MALCTACSLFGGQPDTAPPTPASPISQESKDTARAADAQTVEQIRQMDEEIDRNEGKLRAALEAALGKSPAYPGGPTPPAAPATIESLRAAKIDLYLEPVLDAQGKPVAAGFVQLQDSYTSKVQQLSRKIAEGKASKKEMKFVQEGAKHVVALNDVKAQVRTAVDPAMNAGWMITTGSMTTMQMAAHMVRTRRQMEMTWTDEDYALIQQLLASQRRREAVGAVSIGLMGAYQVAFAEGGDPKVVEQVATATLEALPLAGEASLDEAKAYIDNFEANAEAAHEQYGTQMRKTFGDEEYEAKYKSQIDNMFTQIKSASEAMSATDRMQATSARYTEDLQKCARGESLPSDTLVGPDACKNAKAQAGPDGSLSADALAALTGGIDAKSLAKKGIALALERIPGGRQIQRALDGVKALRNGDPSQALRLAADLIPMPGPAKMALSGAATIAEALPRARGAARRARG